MMHGSIMRRIALVALCTTGPAQADPLALDRPDLHAHFWLSYGLALSLTEVFEGPDPTWGPQWGTGWATLFATGIVGAIGLAKEYVIDDQADGADLVADALGLGLNAAVQFTISF
jgi:hypothetical protein